MQLKILAFIFLILSNFSITSCKYTKIRNTIQNQNLKSSKSISSVKTSEKEKQLGLLNEKYEYNFAQAYSLFKDVALKLFVVTKQGMLETCLELLNNNMTYQDALLKSLWTKMGEIWDDQQMKNSDERSGKISPLTTYTKLSNWKKILAGEFKNMIKYVNFEETLKNQCLSIYSDTPRNEFDLLAILSDSKYFGARYNIGKNDAFIDSMFSVHRDKLLPGSFEQLNKVSANFMKINSDQIQKILDGRSFIPSTPGRKISPYASDDNIPKFAPPKVKINLLF